MSARIRVGLAGTGDIGRLHARALKTNPTVELYVNAGANPAKAAAFAREFEAGLYGSYGEMLADPRVRAVDLCIPNDLHRRYAEQAAAAGKAILCEKPMALSLEDAEAMIAAARRAGVLLMIAHPLRFWPEYIRMREVLRSCELGSCLAMTMRRMLSLYVSVPGEQGWRRESARMGGAVIDLQIHDLDFLYWCFGLPERVFCEATGHTPGDLNHSYATLHYAGGPIALIESSYLLQGDPMVFSAKAVCERGTLDYALHLEQFDMHALPGSEAGRAHGRDAASLVCYRANKAPEVLATQEPDIFASVFQRELAYFVDCVLGRRNNDLLPAEDSLAALQIALACKRSVETGKPVAPERAGATLS